MSTIIRVKRHCDEEPQDAIVINCKRRKINETSEDNIQESDSSQRAVLKLAGTVTDQEANIVSHCKTSLKSTNNSPPLLQSIRNRLREEHYLHMKESRYKVTNFSRSNIEDNAEKEITIVDVEIDKNLPPDTEVKPQYVYDLYYTSSDDFGEIYDQDLIGVYPLSNELIYGSSRDNGVSYSDDDSSDSNCENNWRNDYPDEDEFDNDDDSVTENDMRLAVGRMNLHDDLSSDEGEGEGFTYSIDSEAAGFEEDIDDSDVNRYGERYARFRAKYQKNENNVSNSLDDTDFYYDYEGHSDDNDDKAHGSLYHI